MYTFDGLWYNICFFDVLGTIAGFICIIIGAIGIKNRGDLEAKGCLIIGLIAILCTVPMIIKDVNSISERDFCTINGTFEYYNRAHRQAPFTNEYNFSTADSDKLKVLYLDIFTVKKYFGPGYELTKGAMYEITYDKSSEVIIGITQITS